MKKVLIILYLLVTLGIAGIFVYSSNKRADLLFYTLKENHSYVYKEDRRFDFTIYSISDDPLIMYTEGNSYKLKLDTVSFTLDDVKATGYKMDDCYIVNLTAKIPDIGKNELKSDRCVLNIINGTYELNLDMGTMSILPAGLYEAIKLDHLEASYSIENGSYELAGINVCFTNSYNSISSARIGGYSYGTLSKAIFGSYLPNECNIAEYIPTYTKSKVEETRATGLKNNKLFIPIGYKNDCFIKSGYTVFVLDGKSYYFDCFKFLVSTPSYFKYKNKMTRGEFVNA